MRDETLRTSAWEATAYLDSTRKNPMRRTLVKLKIGCHNLRVETGRWDKILLDERTCPSVGVIKLRTKLRDILR